MWLHDLLEAAEAVVREYHHSKPDTVETLVFILAGKARAARDVIRGRCADCGGVVLEVDGAPGLVQMLCKAGCKQWRPLPPVDDIVRETTQAAGGTFEHAVTTCHACDVEIGEYHDPGCDVERCPFCGQQLIGCDCHWKQLEIPPREDELTPEEVKSWERILRCKGRVPFGAETAKVRHRVGECTVCKGPAISFAGAEQPLKIQGQVFVDHLDPDCACDAITVPLGDEPDIFPDVPPGMDLGVMPHPVDVMLHGLDVDEMRLNADQAMRDLIAEAKDELKKHNAKAKQAPNTMPDMEETYPLGGEQDPVKIRQQIKAAEDRMARGECPTCGHIGTATRVELDSLVVRVEKLVERLDSIEAKLDWIEAAQEEEA